MYARGTSMAAPIVAACLGRYRLRYPTEALRALREQFMRQPAMVPSFDENDDIIVVQVPQRLQLTHIQLKVLNIVVEVNIVKLYSNDNKQYI